MNEHWAYVLSDIWSALRWVIPPAMFMVAPAFGEEPVPGPGLVWMGLAYTGYAAAILGWWA